MSRFLHQVKKGFERAAGQYDMHAKLQREVGRELFSRLKPTISQNSLILDAGCGTGFFQELLRSSGFRSPLIQLDIAYQMCVQTKRYASLPEYGHSHTVNGDLSALPLPDGSLDIAASSLTLQWAEDIKQAMAQLCAAVKPGGYFAFSVMGKGSLCELYRCYQLLGRMPSVHDFPSVEELEVALPEGVNATIDEVVYSYHYADIQGLLKGLRGIGATYRGKRDERVPNRAFFSSLSKTYAAEYGVEDGIKASWHVIYITGKKHD